MDKYRVAYAAPSNKFDKRGYFAKPVIDLTTGKKMKINCADKGTVG